MSRSIVSWVATHARRRLRRVFAQSRIRLPLEARALAPGDWLQIDAETWRVRACETAGTDGARSFVLESAGGARLTARLTAHAGGGGLWTLIRDGRLLELPEDAVVVFPAGDFEAEDDMVAILSPS